MSDGQVKLSELVDVGNEATLAAFFAVMESKYPSDTAWTTTTSLSNGWTGTIRYIKWAGWVIVTFVSVDGSGQTDTTMLTLPSTHRPDIRQWGTLDDVSPTPDKAVAVYVEPNGEVNASGSTDSSGTNIVGSIRFPVIA